MSRALMNDILLQSVGEMMMSKNKEIMGEIIEVTRNPQTRFIEYLILESRSGGHKPRYFAIPASTRFITISDTFTVLFQFPKEDMLCARTVKADQCPTPNLRFGKSIFELSDYQAPEKHQKAYLIQEA